MPQKKGRKKGRNARSNRQSAANLPPALGLRPPAATAAPRRVRDPLRAPMLPGETPDFSEYRQGAPLSENYDTIYIRYKEATKRFYDFMMDHTPLEIRGRPCVNALQIG